MTRCTSATDKNGKRLRVGDNITLLSPFGVPYPPVKIIGIHKQGADGTIITTDYAPNPDYPSHFSCRASNTVFAL